VIDYSFVKTTLERQAKALERIAELLELHPEIKFQRDLRDAEEPRRDRNLRDHCSFCGRGKDQVTKLIAGPGVYICDACTTLCMEILEDPLVNPEKREAEVVKMEPKK